MGSPLPNSYIRLTSETRPMSDVCGAVAGYAAKVLHRVPHQVRPLPATKLETEKCAHGAIS